MIKDQEFLSKKASYCIDLAKKMGATDSNVVVSNSISETVNFRNQKLDESNRSDDLAISITTYIGKRKSSISSSNLLKENLDILMEKCIETTKNTPTPNEWSNFEIFHLLIPPFIFASVSLSVTN